MGTQQVLRTARTVVVATACANFAAAGPVSSRERVAIVDLTASAQLSSGPSLASGGSDASARETLSRALLDAGLEPIAGDGVEHALAGIAADRDTTTLAASLAEAERTLEQLQCPEATAAARRALLVLAARQASGIPVPELWRAWAVLVSCADRTGDIGGAIRAAHGLRTSLSDAVPAALRDLAAKYPAVDTLLGEDRFEVDIATDDGAVVWVDFEPVGTAPARLTLAAGEHLVAASKGARRGSTVFIAEPVSIVKVELLDQNSRWAALAAKIASWRGRLVSPHDIGWILDQVDARLAVVRRGDTVQAWGRAGALEKPRPLGGVPGDRPLTDAGLVARHLAQGVHHFSARAPDPNRPLLVDGASRARRDKGGDESTPWWVYGAIGASIAAGALVIYLAREDGSPTHLELRRP